MDAHEKIQRGYSVSVRRLPEVAGRYRLSYVPRGLAHARGPGGKPKPVPEFRATAQVEGDQFLVSWDKAPSDPDAAQSDFDGDARARIAALHKWVERLTPLVSSVRTWVEELGWVARDVEKPMKDAEIGDYKAPGLVLQRDM